jgi:hypothetical protein
MQMQIFCPPSIHASTHHSPSHPCSVPKYLNNLVLARTRLACLQLIQVPSTDVQTALVVIHAFPEVLNIALARAAAVLALLGVVCLVLVCEVGGLGGFGRRGGLGGGPAEHAAQGVADGGADCYTAGRLLVFEGLA